MQWVKQRVICFVHTRAEPKDSYQKPSVQICVSLLPCLWPFSVVNMGICHASKSTNHFIWVIECALSWVSDTCHFTFYCTSCGVVDVTYKNPWSYRKRHNQIFLCLCARDSGGQMHYVFGLSVCMTVLPSHSRKSHISGTPWEGFFKFCTNVHLN